MFQDNVTEEWLYEHIIGGIFSRHEWKPTWLTNELVDKYLWRHSKQFLLMSATFPPLAVFSKQLGIPLEEIDYHELDSSFPVENRKIYLNPVANLTYKTMKQPGVIPNLLREVEDILDYHGADKGLIHCTNYKLSNAIMQTGRKRLINHDSSDKFDRLEYFMSSREPVVFVSPS